MWLKLMGGDMATKPLKRWSTDELESALNLDTLNKIEKYEAERILREREKAPDLKSGTAVI